MTAALGPAPEPELLRAGYASAREQFYAAATPEEAYEQAKQAERAGYINRALALSTRKGTLVRAGLYAGVTMLAGFLFPEVATAAATTQALILIAMLYLSRRLWALLYGSKLLTPTRWASAALPRPMRSDASVAALLSAQLLLVSGASVLAAAGAAAGAIIGFALLQLLTVSLHRRVSEEKVRAAVKRTARSDQLMRL